MAKQCIHRVTDEIDGEDADREPPSPRGVFGQTDCGKAAKKKTAKKVAKKKAKKGAKKSGRR